MVTRHLGALLGVVSLVGLGSLGVACGGDDDDNGNSSGASGTAGTSGGGTAGTGGSAGNGGPAGMGGDGGTNGGSSGDCSTAATCPQFKTDPATAAEPPAKPAATTPLAGADVVQAVNAMFVGDTDRQGNASADAWKSYGFDLDGWTSTASQGFHCQPQGDGKNKTIRDDGPGGIDNLFGKVIVDDILKGFADSPSAAVTGPIVAGTFSILFKFDKLGDAATGTSVRSQVFAAAGTPDPNDATLKLAPPASGDWSTYVWHPYSQGLEADGVTSKVLFPDAYITNNVWVSGDGQGKVDLQLSVAGQTLALTVQHPRFSLDLSDRKQGKNGILGGILETEQFITSLQKIAGTVDVQFCDASSTAFQTIANRIRAASDILTDGTQDPAKMCNGISVGLGFTTVASTLGAKVDSGATTNPCAVK